MNHNAWHGMTPSDYDAHMSHPSVGQTQMLSKIIKEQFELLPADQRSEACVAILGITNGNGLEHIPSCGIGRVLGIDVHPPFLEECKKRYANVMDRVSLYSMDLVAEVSGAIGILSPCDLIIANLLIEHIHLENFEKILAGLPKHGQIVSCVIQVNPDGSKVSSSGSEHLFEAIVEHVEEANESALTLAMERWGYVWNEKTIYDLPNGKRFVRLDYSSQTAAR